MHWMNKTFYSFVKLQKCQCWLCLMFIFRPYASLLCRNAPCPPACWVDSGSVHPLHCVWVSHTAVSGANWVCCQWEQHSCGPPGRGESGRPSQRDSFGSGKTQNKLITDGSNGLLTLHPITLLCCWTMCPVKDGINYLFQKRVRAARWCSG